MHSPNTTHKTSQDMASKFKADFARFSVVLTHTPGHRVNTTSIFGSAPTGNKDRVSLPPILSILYQPNRPNIARSIMSTSSSHAISVFSPSFGYQLPFELEREICDIVAHNFPKCLPSIVLIARRFRIWFEPELYRTIRSGEGRVIPPLYSPRPSTDDFIGAVLDRPRIQAFGHHVQNVLLQKRSATEIASVLECCPNVTNLALWIIHGTCSHLIPILEKMPLRKFSFDPSYFFENYASDSSIPFNQPIFLNLTHLEIINATSSWSKWKQLALLPRLTHLAVAGIVNQQLIDHVLEECAALELFIMFYLSMGFLVGEVTFPQQDDRVVLLKSVEDHLDHWEKGARGEEDFWVTAQIRKEEAIQRRKRQALLRNNEGIGSP